MRLLALTCSIALLAACTKPDDTPVPDSGAAGIEPVSAPTMSLADVAGNWDVSATPESGSDMSPTRYTMVATSDMTGWTITFVNRPGQPIPLRVVSADGDSIVTEAGPFESNRRAGVQVTTRSVMRLDGGRMVGSTRASYAVAGPDTMLMLRVEGTRAP